MNKIPSAVIKRLETTVPKFQKILKEAKGRDVNESDTVTIVTDMLQEVFGYDKYSEITSEYSIQGTYCDLAVITNKRVEYLVEVKAIGLELNDKHLKQAINYASGAGIRWVVLTNGIKWEIHRISVDKKVSHNKLFYFDITEMNPKSKEQQDLLFLLCKKGITKNLIDDYYTYRKSVNRHTIGILLLTDPIATTVSRELRKLNPDIKVNNIEEIKSIIGNEIIKREIHQSEAGIEAGKLINKFKKKQEREKAKAKATATTTAAATTTATAPTTTAATTTEKLISQTENIEK